MRAALAEARATGSARTAEVPVGAVIVDGNGAVIGSGRNIREVSGDPTGHAEVVALRAAGQARRDWRLDDCTLVVTLEPCTMCAGAVLASRVPRLVFGAEDPRAGAAGSVWDVLHDPRLGQPVEVVSGVLAEECAAVLREFFGERR
jgi:tRNA(adenine34) deaminase